jgi:transposase
MATRAAQITDEQPKPLTTTREERGRAIAKLGGIRKLGARYIVPSQSANSNVPTYLVDVVEQTCTCADYELRRRPCKHYEACMFWLAADGGTVDEETGQVTAPKKQSKQDWRAYNAAQTTERERVPQLLKALCDDGVEDPPRHPKGGRKRVPKRDLIFALVMKVYTTFSGRRADTDIRSCHERGHITKAPHYNTVFRTMEDEATTAILTRLIEESAAPLAEIENLAGQFAADASGFSTVTYDRWFDQKHGKLRAQHGWVKLHVMVGTLTNVVTSAKVSPEADCPLLPELLAATVQRFAVKEVSADKAYLAKYNLEAIDKVGAVPFIPFKSNSVGMASKSFHWRKMWAHFSLKSEDFLKRYHRRSNVESTIGAIKALAGGAVRSKLPVARANEVLCKVLLHNLTCIVHAIEEFGIEVDLAPKLTVVKP